MFHLRYIQDLSPGVVDSSPVVVPLELDQSGPSGVFSEGMGASEGGATIELIRPSVS